MRDPAAMNSLLASLDAKTSGKWLLLSLLVGLAAGGAAIVFERLIELIGRELLTPVTGVDLPTLQTVDFAPWIMVAVMTAGGFVSGLLCLASRDIAGSGMDSAIEAFHQHRGRLAGRVPLLKLLASAVTLGTGGSGGREGPISLIAGSLGALMSDVLKLSDRDRRILLVAGMAAGVGAIFRAPLAGALFAAEILYSQSDFEADAIIPAATSSIIGYSVYQLALPGPLRYHPLLGTTAFEPAHVEELLTYTALAVLLAAVGAVYVGTFRLMQRLFDAAPLWTPLKPAIGAGLAGLVGIGLWTAQGDDASLAVLGTGYGMLRAAASPDVDAVPTAAAAPIGDQSANAVGLSATLLLTIGLGKIVTTSLTISSGGSGGVFGPSIVIGGCLGAAAGQWMGAVLPGWTGPTESLAVVGMAGFFAGCGRAPFSTVIMVSELTGGYELLLPTMWVSTLCFLLSRRFLLYPSQVPTRLESPAHRGDFIIDVLEGLTVEEVYDRQRAIVKIPEAMPLEEIVHVLASTRQHYFPVVDSAGKMIGIFASDDVRTYLYDETIWSLANARDVMTAHVVAVTPDDDLGTAIRGFTSIATDELPVVDAADKGELLGTLRHKDAIAAYNRRLIEHQQEMAEE